ncbi:hypothetical protein FNH13_08545 [Ornithinimicrobium ciconiae]|uniref:Uncharacterized protein n=1 Tax=Ornithinimicrobium ciconiae TaxID=2594265 RepID=A0A516GA29_9MICO|nr:hypothetical protein [Ornithinimicrobium ciconiae]QDO88384.1 hypothetical protein FNH13_08545 [Ornithinimicrobium ciconiae]
MPAVTLAAAAPAMAASPEPGLNGWVVISRGTTGWPFSTCRVRYDGYHDGAGYYNGTRLGLWVWDATSSQITTAPSLTIHLPYQVSWQTDTGNNGWSTPTSVGTDSEGFYLYRSTYSGSYSNGTGSDGLPEVVLNGRPHFVGTSNGSCPNNRRQKITRSVGINGETIAFTREVSFPSNVVYYEKVEPDAEANAESAATDTDTAAQTASPEDASPEVATTQPAAVEKEEVQFTVG